MTAHDHPVGMVALFDKPDDLVRAARAVRESGYAKWDCISPYPVHGLESAMGLAPSPLARICLGAGFVGACGAMLMQWWMNAHDYPINVGGKPLFSWPAFIPITFELFVLFTAVATMACLILFCRLGRWHSPLHDSGVSESLTSNRFAVVLYAEDPLFTHDTARALLEGTGSNDVRPLIEHASPGGPNP